MVSVSSSTPVSPFQDELNQRGRPTGWKMGLFFYVREQNRCGCASAEGRLVLNKTVSKGSSCASVKPLDNRGWFWGGGLEEEAGELSSRLQGQRREEDQRATIKADSHPLKATSCATATESHRRRLCTRRKSSRVGLTCEFATRFKNNQQGSRRLFQLLFICEARETFPRLKRPLQLFCSAKLGKCAFASQSESLTR